MKLIKPDFVIINQEPGLDGMYKQIELAGRTCYKSEDKITIDSAKGFVDRMVKSGHGAMLEHGTIYLYIPYDAKQEGNSYIWDNQTNRHYDPYILKYHNNAHTRVHYDEDFNAYITTNYRVLIENNWVQDLEYMCEPKSYHEYRYTVKFICDRGVTHEFVRHRVFSFAQESTRYCNYSKDKFNNEIVYILPPWMDEVQLGVHDSNRIILEGFNYNEFAKDNIELTELAFMVTLAQAEVSYHRLISLGWKAQEARGVLPNALKTEIVMTGFAYDWEHFFYLRDAVSAHPQARELAKPLHKEFIKRKYI